METNLFNELSSKGYWPAVAMEYFNERLYSRAVELCTIRLKEYPDLLSGRLILARALYHSGQYESAEEEFRKVLQRDPQNLVSLKYLGDLKFRAKDEATAMTYYSRVLEIEPNTSGLSSELDRKAVEETKILTIKRAAKKEDDISAALRELPFKTETVGDLLMEQGHTRLALEVFRELASRNQNPRLNEKIEKALDTIKNRDKNNVPREN